MCGSKKSKAAPVAPAPIQMPYKVMADNSNQQRQIAAIAPEAGNTQASYGSELASAGSPPVAS